MSTRPALDLFDYDHLPAKLQAISEPFHAMAVRLNRTLPVGVESDMALRKLLEAKDCAVRARLQADKPSEAEEEKAVRDLFQDVQEAREEFGWPSFQHLPPIIEHEWKGKFGE